MSVQCGPKTRPNSRRGRAEVKRRTKLISQGRDPGPLPFRPVVVKKQVDTKMPVCSVGLGERGEKKWADLCADLTAAGFTVAQLDGRLLAAVVDSEQDFEDLQTRCRDPLSDPSKRIVAIRLKSKARKDYLGALMAIGGSPIVRLRMRIAPEEPAKAKLNPADAAAKTNYDAWMAL